MSTRENYSEPDATRKYNITLKAPPCLCVRKIQYLGDVSRQIQHSASPHAVLASQHTPSYCIFHTHVRRCFNSNLWHLLCCLKKVLIRKINASIWFRWMKKTSSLIEDKRKDKAQRVHTRRNPKRYIPLVSLSLWHKMVAVHCFVWPLGL